MLGAFALALGQLGDRRILTVLAKSVLITVVIFAVLGAGLWYGLSAWGPGDGNGGFIAAILAGLLVILSLWLLFRLIALAVLQLFGDEVVRAVEARHYPNAAAEAQPLGWREELRIGTSSLLRALGYNLLALPFAFVLMATAIGPAILFAAVNAVLLGRELTEMVALRHRDATGNAPLPGFAKPRVFSF